MPEHKNKTFTYHRVRYQSDPSGRTMQKLLNETFDKTTVKDRLHAASDDTEEHSFMNHKSNMKGFFSANLWKYEDGRIAQIIKANFDSEYVESKAIPPDVDPEDGTIQHYLAGKLYFTCFENHMIICGDATLRPIHLERYLHELITRRNKSLPKTFQFYLEKTIPYQTQKKLFSGVKSISLSSDMQVTSSEEAKSASQRIRETVTVENVLKACDTLFGSDTSKAKLPKFNEDTKVKVSLLLDWRRESRKVEASEQLDTFANTFRNVDDDDLDIVINTVQGGKYRGEDLRISASKSVEHKEQMPVFDDISDKMIKWYTELVETKQI